MGKARALFVFLALILATSVQAQDEADTIYRNGKIYTVDEAGPWAEAVANADLRSPVSSETG